MRCLVAIALVVAVLGAEARAGQATCSNPGLPVGAAASSDLLPGRLMLSLTNSLLTVSNSEGSRKGRARFATGPQVDYGIVAGLGVVTSFDLASRASYGAADVAPLGEAGTAAPLVPVPGKITVFDLWAEWCAPCRELDDKLAALSRRYPDKFAVRKLAVVDNDRAAWLRYLAPGSFELPHITVYGADGVLLFDKTAPPDELVTAVEALLR